MEPPTPGSDHDGSQTQVSARARQVQFDAPADAPDAENRRGARFYSDDDPRQESQSPFYGSRGSPVHGSTEMVGFAEEQNASVNELLVGTSAGFFGPKLLVFGCVCGMLGFLLVITVLVTCQIELDRYKQYIQECSEYRPLPSSVSELVHRWESVSGRIFFGVQFIAGLSIYLSAYGFCFKNSACDCYLDLSFTVCGVHFPMQCVNRIIHELDLRWCDVRMFVPPVGYMLVCLVPTIPVYKAQHMHEVIMIACHCIAAFMMFLGLMACELHFWRHHVDYADPSREFEAKAMAELSSNNPYAPLAVGHRHSHGSIDRHALAFPSRAPGEYTYFIGYKELFCRRVFNLGNALFFFLFVAFQVLLDRHCTPATFMLADPGRSCQDSSKGCTELESDVECAAANAMLVDDIIAKRKTNTFLNVPVNFPPCEISQGDVTGERPCGAWNEASELREGLRNLPFGCFTRTDRNAGGFFYWNPDQTNGVSNLHNKDGPNMVCKCGRHRTDESLELDNGQAQSFLAKLFEPTTRMGQKLNVFMKILQTKNLRDPMSTPIDLLDTDDENSVVQSSDEASSSPKWWETTFGGRSRLLGGTAGEKEKWWEDAPSGDASSARSTATDMSGLLGPSDRMKRDLGKLPPVKFSSARAAKNLARARSRVEKPAQKKVLPANVTVAAEHADDEAEHDSSWNKHAEHEIRAIDLADLSSVGVESDGTASEGPRLTIAREADSEQPRRTVSLAAEPAPPERPRSGWFRDSVKSFGHATEGFVFGNWRKSPPIPEVHHYEDTPMSNIIQQIATFEPKRVQFDRAMSASRHKMAAGAEPGVDPDGGLVRTMAKATEWDQTYDVFASPGSPMDNANHEDQPYKIKAQMIEMIARTDSWEGVRCGACKLYTIGSFISEILAGLSVVWLHLIIWFFCEERFLHTKDRRNTAAHACHVNHRSWRRAQKLAAQLEEEALVSPSETPSEASGGEEPIREAQSEGELRGDPSPPRRVD